MLIRKTNYLHIYSLFNLHPPFLVVMIAGKKKKQEKRLIFFIPTDSTNDFLLFSQSEEPELNSEFLFLSSTWADKNSAYLLTFLPLIYPLKLLGFFI